LTQKAKADLVQKKAAYEQNELKAKTEIRIQSDIYYYQHHKQSIQNKFWWNMQNAQFDHEFDMIAYTQRSKKPLISYEPSDD
jgi:hypothetical protein